MTEGRPTLQMPTDTPPTTDSDQPLPTESDGGILEAQPDLHDAGGVSDPEESPDPVHSSDPPTESDSTSVIEESAVAQESAGGVAEEDAASGSDAAVTDTVTAKVTGESPTVSDAEQPPAQAGDAEHTPAPAGDAAVAPATPPDFAQLLEKSLEKARPIRTGDRLRAVVQRIEDQFSYLDYGGPREAVIATQELRDPEGNLKIGVGERIDVTVAESGETLLVHRLVRKSRDRSVLKQAFASAATVEGKVTGTNKGGFDVQVSGFRAFCPISQIDRTYCSDPQSYVGQTLPFRIIEYKEGGRRVVVSRRALLDEERRREAAETRARLQVGDELEGTVVRLQPFGAFVDIGGLDGLVHVSELRHGRVSDPAQVVKVGEKIRVKVIGIENLGSEKGERVSLSARALEGDPWQRVSGELAVGATVQGKVLRLMNYGAFIEILPGVEGLLHISEMADKRLRHPREAVSEGSTVEVRVLELDPERRRLSLSMRPPGSPPHPEDSEPAAAKLAVGTAIEGSVSSVKPYGVFVRIESPVSGVDGLLPTEETHHPRGTDLEQAMPVGSTVSAEVLRVDTLGRIRLTQRSASEREASRTHEGSRERQEGRGESGRREGGRDRDGRDRDRDRSREGRLGRERGMGSRGGRDGEAERRESRRRPRRDPGSPPGEAQELQEGEEERRGSKTSSPGLGIMAKAFRRVLDGH